MRAKYVFPAGALMMTKFIEGSFDVTTPATVASTIKTPFNPGGLTVGITGLFETGFGTGLMKGSRRPRASYLYSLGTLRTGGGSCGGGAGGFPA